MKKAVITLTYPEPGYFIFATIVCENHDGPMYDTQVAIKKYLEYALQAEDIEFGGRTVRYTAGNNSPFRGSFEHKTFMEEDIYEIKLR